jgi:hypothetical protein
MCRSLNALWAHLKEARPTASRAKLELAMAESLRHLETAERAFGKEWMTWFPARSPRQRFVKPSGRRWQRAKPQARGSP